ncbi:MAG: dephospho-CoA kinase [Bacteroidota bacterium]
MVVGLTGGIGSGKSTIASMFIALGVPVYDSDKEAKVLMQTSGILREQISNVFGRGAYKGRLLNRKLISQRVFNDKSLLLRLNAIVHPAVRQHFSEWAASQTHAYIIQETALIFENDMQSNYDSIILVTAPKKVRMQRVMVRDAVSEDAVLARMKNQWNHSNMTGQADFVIENTNLADTEKKVFEIHRQLMVASDGKSKN